ncbi:MAG: hypothetical protein ABIH25_00295 [Candidatus Woesearchaeota archaeon]
MSNKKVYFEKSREKEERNYYMMANFKCGPISRGNFFDEEFTKKIKNKKFEDVRDIIKQKIKKDYESLTFDLDGFLRNAKKEWSKVEEEYLKKLEKIMQKPFLANKVICYSTILPRCNYWYKLPCPWFKLSILYPKKKWNQVCMHEIMHFMFHWHYWDSCRKHLNEEKTWHLKEALTFILNEEFSDLLKEKDIGYPPHQELRKKLLKIWKKDKDFKSFLDKSIKVMKMWKIE